MARAKIPDHLMTPAQRKQRQRNERYRQKLLNANVVNINKMPIQQQTQTTEEPVIAHVAAATTTQAQIPQVPQVPQVIQAHESQTIDAKPDSKGAANEWQKFEVVYTNPAICLASLSVLAITSLLIIFQATAYLNDGLGYLSWAIAGICEISLIALTILYSGMRSKLAGLLFLGMFSYCLGVMSYDLKSSEAEAVESSQFSSKSFKSLDKSLSQAQRSLDLALRRGESGNISKHTKTVENLTKMMSETQVAPDKTALISSKTSGLIGLRAILMLISALLIHCVIIFVRKA